MFNYIKILSTILFLLFYVLKTAAYIPSINPKDANSMKTLTSLSENLEKWNHLCPNFLESKLISTENLLVNINSNINNLQEKVHVWDAFQLHISAWNDQLASLDRKIDILSKGQERMSALLESKLDVLASLENKINDGLKEIYIIGDRVLVLNEYQSQQLHHNSNHLFQEFATRGILNAVKMIEKKLDRLQKRKLIMKYKIPDVIEKILNNISFKLDTIFDKIIFNKSKDNEYNHYNESNKRNSLRRRKRNANNNITLDLFEKVSRIEDISKRILINQNITDNKVEKILRFCKKDKTDNMTRFETQFGFNNTSNNRTINVAKTTNINEKFGCEDLDGTYKSGIYYFGNSIEVNAKNRTYNKRFCLIRDKIAWTVIQRREHDEKQNFNRSWFHYKNGFGDLRKDFWFGNDFINKLTTASNNLILRIEMEDFEGHYVWAEYRKFLVLSEDNKYKLIINGYRGNASDSFLSHNGTFFSTFDRKNDKAPDCCPCALSYGSGWWFNSCFECNLNGVYYEKENYIGGYMGIIWENWLGDYSLKKTLMMVRELGKQKDETTTPWPYYEDP